MQHWPVERTRIRLICLSFHDRYVEILSLYYLETFPWFLWEYFLLWLWNHIEHMDFMWVFGTSLFHPLGRFSSPLVILQTFQIFPSFWIFFSFSLFLHLFTFSILQIIFIYKIFNSDYFLLFLIRILLSPHPLSPHLLGSPLEEPGVITDPSPLIYIFFISFSLFIYLFLARQNVLISSMFWGVLRPSHPS